MGWNQPLFPSSTTDHDLQLAKHVERFLVFVGSGPWWKRYHFTIVDGRSAQGKCLSRKMDSVLHYKFVRPARQIQSRSGSTMIEHQDPPHTLTAALSAASRCSGSMPSVCSSDTISPPSGSSVHATVSNCNHRQLFIPLCRVQYHPERNSHSPSLSSSHSEISSCLCSAFP